jgi:hypothetical protein
MPMCARRAKELHMGIMDTIKGWFGGNKPDVNAIKEQAGQAKDTVDNLVEEHADKIPDPVEGAYDKASDAAEKIIPGDEPS